MLVLCSSIIIAPQTAAQNTGQSPQETQVATAPSKPVGNFPITVPANLPDTSTPPQAGAVSGFGDRAKSRDRNGPRRENMQAIGLLGNHVSALIGGFEQGAGFGFGLELSTADKIPGVEFRAKALTSTRFYRRFELEAYFPKIGDDKTHLDIWFNYQKRTRDNFFGIGPRTAEDPETNFAADQRSYNISFFRDFAKGVQAGVYAQVANTDAYRGEDDEDTPVDLLFSGHPATTPVTRYLPGLNVNAKMLTYGAFAEFDLRNNDRGLTKGGYFYVRGASFDSLDNDLFSDFGWNEIELDGRVYMPIFTDFTSLALRPIRISNHPKATARSRSTIRRG